MLIISLARGRKAPPRSAALRTRSGSPCCQDCIARGWAGEDSRAPANDTRGKCTNMETITMSPRASATNKFPSQLPQSTSPVRDAGGGRQAGQTGQTGQTGQARQNEPGARSQEVPGGGGGIDVGIDVDTRGIGRDLGFCSAHPGNPSNSSRAARAARTVADPPDWKSGSWVMHAPLDN